MLTFQPLVLLLFRVDAHSYIAEDGLWTRCRNHSVLARLFDYVIAQVVEFAMLIVVDHLFVTQRRLSLWVPVHHAQTAVDQALTIQVAEHFNHGSRTFLVHRKCRSVPVAGATERAQLFENDASVLVGPSPGVLEKLFAGQIALVNTLLFETFNHFCLSRN